METGTPIQDVSAKMPSTRQQSWGVVVSIVVIVGMIIMGAFYAWGERIAEERALTMPTETGEKSQ
jgi:hypothetical protein